MPKEKIKELSEWNHDHILAGHLGIAKTLARVKRQFVWPGLGKDVTEYLNSCIAYAKRKACWSTKAPLKPLPLVANIWEQVTESSKGNKYILVLSDYGSRYVMAIPIKDQKAHTIAEHLVKKLTQN